MTISKKLTKAVKSVTVDSAKESGVMATVTKAPAKTTTKKPAVKKATPTAKTRVSKKSMTVAEAKAMGIDAAPLSNQDIANLCNPGGLVATKAAVNRSHKAMANLSKTTRQKGKVVKAADVAKSETKISNSGEALAFKRAPKPVPDESPAETPPFFTDEYILKNVLNHVPGISELDLKDGTLGLPSDLKKVIDSARAELIAELAHDSVNHFRSKLDLYVQRELALD